MMKISFNKYIVIRNIALFAIIGYLLYFVFPFPPIIWRLLFVFVALVAICCRFKELEKHEKLAILFLCFNLLYFIVSFNWLKAPSYTQIGNIVCTLLAIPLFTSLGRKGVFTNRFMTISVLLLLIAGFGYFVDGQRVMMEKQMYETDDITNNAGVVFLFLLPFLIIERNRVLCYLVFVLCISFLLLSSKRGNLVCAVIPSLLFVYYILGNREIKIHEKLILGIFLIISCFFFMNQIEENDYLLERIEETAEGDSSGRDYIYAKAWNIWADSENVYNMLLGHGYDTTVHHRSMKIHAHNDWLEILVNYGLVGVVLYFCMFKNYTHQILSMKDRRKKYVLISIISIWFLKSLFSMGFTEPTMFVLLFSMGYVYSNEIKMYNK